MTFGAIPRDRRRRERSILRLLRGDGQRERTAERALAYERRRQVAAAGDAEQGDSSREAAARLAGAHAIPFGTLPDGTVVWVALATLIRHGLFSGTSGFGKTRAFVHKVLYLVNAMIEGTIPELEIEIIDPKGEAIDFIKAALADRYITGSTRVQAWIRDNIWYVGWHRDRVTPTPPFDNLDGRISDAYLADLRTQATAEATDYRFADASLHAYRMYCQLATALRHPLNYAVCTALFTDPVVRARLLRNVADPSLRAYFETVDISVPRSTILAMLRRVQYLLNFPEVRAGVGIPPAAVDQLGLQRDGLLRLVDVSTRFALPSGKAGERASHRLIDVLRSAPARDRRRPAILVIEEAAALLSRSPELAEPLITGVRTLRFFNVGIWFVAQDFTTALTPALLEPLVLNTFWVSMFQSRRDASWLAEQVVAGSEGAKAEANARRAFQRDVENLPQQTYYFWPKGERVLRLRAMDCPDPTAAGLGLDQLVEVFDREVAVRSMVKIATADRLIAEWEASVLSRREIAPPTRGSAHPYADLMRDLGTDDPDEPEGDTDG